MTLDEIRKKLPPELEPWIAEYGAAIISMSGEELKTWLDTLIKGNVEEAYADILSKMDNSALSGEWTKLNALWQAENVRNAERLSLQKNALAALLKILLAVALAAASL